MITDEGVELDPLGNVKIHPALALFPQLEGDEFDDLVASITANGLREPIVYAPDGRLLDGRARLRACLRVGASHVSRVETSEPWAWVIRTKLQQRDLPLSQRAMIAASAPYEPRTGGGDRRSDGFKANGVPRDPLQTPRVERLAYLFRIGSASLSRARTVWSTGSADFRSAVASGEVPLTTACRVIRGLDDKRQAEFLRQVRDGADPQALASAMLRAPVDPRPAAGPARVDNRSPHRHRHLGVPALSNLAASLEALDLVLRTAPDGLDPAITSEEAARWAGDLSKGRSAIRRVLTLLNDRKEST
jgi:hypothetical protein